MRTCLHRMQIDIAGRVKVKCDQYLPLIRKKKKNGTLSPEIAPMPKSLFWLKWDQECKIAYLIGWQMTSIYTSETGDEMIRSIGMVWLHRVKYSSRVRSKLEP